MEEKKVKKNIYQKLISARDIFATEEIKKSKTNTYAKYKYMELDDILPISKKIEKEIGAVVVISFEGNSVIGKFVNTDKPDEEIVFKSYYSETLSTGKINGVQQIGAQHTYFRRYMYMLVFDIIENDIVEMNTGKEKVEKKHTFVSFVTKNSKKFNEEEMTYLRKLTKEKMKEEEKIKIAEKILEGREDNV